MTIVEIIDDRMDGKKITNNQSVIHFIFSQDTKVLLSKIFSFIKMAGRVRQPIDEAKFEQYLNENVPEIQTPIKLKQVREKYIHTDK